MIQNNDQSIFLAKITKRQHKFLHIDYFVANSFFGICCLKVILKLFLGESVVTLMPIGSTFFKFFEIMLLVK
jgi:hypothetical protein